MDCLLKRMRESNCGTSTSGVYSGAAVHADDLRTIASSRDEVLSQADVIRTFTQDTHLNLNVSKLEVVKVSKNFQHPENFIVAGHPVTTTAAAKCLGVWWQSNQSASKSINENIRKEERHILLSVGWVLFTVT